MVSHADDGAGRQTILVVDDLFANRLSLEALLTKANYRVVTAADGKEALALVEREKPALVLLDVLMPVMSGTEVLQELKRRDETRLIPVVMLSIQSAIADRIDGLTHGADDYIGKPFNNEELLAKIRALLKIRDLSEQLRNAEKLAVLAQVAVSVNHQINNPLSAILYSVELLEHDLGGDEQGAREQLQTIRDALERIKSVMFRLRGATEVVPICYLGDIEMLDF